VEAAGEAGVLHLDRAAGRVYDAACTVDLAAVRALLDRYGR
jgi:hypothetical protein